VKNDEVLLPDVHVILRHNVATNTVLAAAGRVESGKIRVQIRRSAGGKQDNVLALCRPMAVSLDDSGLVQSGAFRESASPLVRTDELFVFDNTAVLRGKPVAATYYYWSGGWRKFGSGATNFSAEPVLTPGSGFIVRSGAGSSVAWENLPGY
jgi:uncharacterized protein (TIGR02597 family)